MTAAGKHPQTLRRRPFYWFCQMVCQFVVLAMFRFRVFGRRNVPRSGSALIVCNHQSFLDPVLAAVALPRECHFMARDTLFGNPCFRWLCESLNAFPIRRGQADLRAIKESLRRLQSGAAVVAFPEGTRTHDGTVGAMQPGAVLLARRAGAPIVPAVILGAFEAWPRSAKIPRPRRIIVAYADPITVEQMSQMNDDACIAEVRDRILALQAKYQNLLQNSAERKPLRVRRRVA